jgi:hypothetical protein
MIFPPIGFASKPLPSIPRKLPSSERLSGRSAYPNLPDSLIITVDSITPLSASALILAKSKIAGSKTPIAIPPEMRYNFVIFFKKNIIKAKRVFTDII